MSSGQTLARYRNQNRLLLLFAPSSNDPVYVEQRRLWKGEKDGFADRQLVVISALADSSIVEGVVGTTPDALQRDHKVDPQRFEVVLIGKDGHDAYRSSKPVSPKTIYSLIDAMPMRKAELKRAVHHRASGVYPD